MDRMKKKAVVLLSGGLDSALAAKMMLFQGVEVIGVCFTSPFFGDENAKKVAKELCIELFSIDISEKMLPLIKEPKYGFGRWANPCIDCHILMIKEAGSFLRKKGADFIVTGEVLGERPKSQTRAALRIIEEESGMAGLILRPLSAKLLPQTKVEEQGWVNREELLGLHGRSRKAQLSLAKEWGITAASTPAGGCLLTDPCFSQRVKDLLLHCEPTLDDLWLLRIGRHFRIDACTKLIIARNHKENEKIKEFLKPSDVLLKVKEYKGPLGLLRGEWNEEKIIKIAPLIVRYSAAQKMEKVKVECTTVNYSFTFFIEPKKNIEAKLIA